MTPRFDWLPRNAPSTLLAVTALGLLVTTGMTLYQHSRLTQLEQALEIQTPLDLTENITQHIATLEQALADLQARPVPASATSLKESNATFEHRLDAFEDALRLQASDSDLKQLWEKVNALEERVLQVDRPVAARAIAPQQKAKPSAQPARPQLRVVALEVRGGQQFLAILTGSGSSLADLRLIRVGDQIDGWRLDRIQNDGATFAHRGARYTAPLP